MIDGGIYQRIGEVAFREFAKQAYANRVWKGCRTLQYEFRKHALRQNKKKLESIELTDAIDDDAIGALLDAGYSYTEIADSLNDQFAKKRVEKKFLKGSTHSYVNYRTREDLLKRKYRACTKGKLDELSAVAGDVAKDYFKLLIETTQVSTRVSKKGTDYFCSDQLDTPRGRALEHVMAHPSCKRDVNTIESIFLKDASGMPVRDISKSTGIPFCSIYIILNEAYPERKKPQPGRKLTQKQREYVQSHPELSAAQLGCELHIPSQRISKYAAKKGIVLFTPVLPDPVEMAATLRRAGIVNGRVIAR